MQVSGGANFHVASSVGRLVEIRPQPLHSVEVVLAMGAAVRSILGQLEAEAICCVDWRRLRLLGPEVAEALTASMKGHNRRVMRSAALVGEHATLGLQVERLIKTAEHPARKAFRAPKDLLAWLSEVCTPAETERARLFLLET